MDICQLSQGILSETEKIIAGEADRIRLIIMAVLADGHILLDDLHLLVRRCRLSPWRKHTGETPREF